MPAPRRSSARARSTAWRTAASGDFGRGDWMLAVSCIWAVCCVWTGRGRSVTVRPGGAAVAPFPSTDKGARPKTPAFRGCSETGDLSMATAGPASAARVFRDYDQASLDRALNLRARWPDHPQFFARWAKDSAAVRESLPCRLDLAYGETPAETLDLFPAADDGAAPLLAFIHGGYW